MPDVRAAGTVFAGDEFRIIPHVMSRLRAYAVLALVVTVGAICRLTRLTHESIWNDEALTIQSATVPFTQVLQAVRTYENLPPLYFVLLNRWVALFGSSDFSLRLPSALCGVAAIVSVFFLAKELFASE